MGQSELEALKRAREQEGGNPFDVIRAVRGQPSASEEVQENPFDLGGFSPSTFAPDAGTAPTSGERFLRGVGRGVIHPVRAFIPKDTSVEETSLGFAGGLGEFVGAGLTLIPIFKGTAAVLTGTGLLRSASVAGSTVRYLAPFGSATAASITGANVVTGIGSFAAFETFAGDTIEEAPKRFMRGIVEGAAWELGMLGVARAWRGGTSGWKVPKSNVPSTVPPPLVESQIHVDPLRLRLEYAMRPLEGETQEEVLKRLQAIQSSEGGAGGFIREWGKLGKDATGRERYGYVYKTDPAAATRGLHESFLGLMRNHMPGGQAVLSGLTQREVTRLYKVAQEAGEFQLGVFRRVKGEDAFDVLLIDKDRFVLKGKEFAEGQPTIPEMMKAIRNHFDEAGLSIEIGPDKAKGFAGMWTGKEYTKSGIDEIEISTLSEKYAVGRGVSTLLHEFMHHLAAVRARKILLQPNRSDLKKLIFGDFFNLERAEFGANPKLEVISKEFEAATEELLTIGNKNIFGKSDAVARADAKATMMQGSLFDQDYYFQHTEMISRMAELMLYDPQLAKKIAPTASRLVGQMIQSEAASVRHLMSREAQSLLDVWQQLWRKRVGGPITIFEKLRPTIGVEQVAEFNSKGWFNGMRALLDGRDVEFISRTEAKALIKHLDTGVEEIIDATRLQRPTIQSVARRNETILKAVDDVLNYRTKAIPVNLSEVSQVDKAMRAVRRAIVDTADFLHLKDKSVPQWLKELPDAVKEQLIAKHGQLDFHTLQALEAGGDALAKSKAILSDALDHMGFKGLVRTDNGIPEIFVRDRATVTKSNVLESEAFGARVSSSRDEDIIFPDLAEFIRQQLRENGVLEVDMPYYFDVAYNRMKDRMLRIVDPEVATAAKNVQVAASAQGKKSLLKKTKKKKTADIDHDEDQIELLLTEQALARSNIEATRLPDGTIELRDFSSKTVLGHMADDEAAAAYARDLTADNVGPSLGDFPIPGGNNGGSALPPKPNKPALPSDSPLRGQGKAAQLADSFLFPRLFAALENVAKKFEHQGLGAAYTKVYLPAHNNMLKVMNELSVIVRDDLGGLTFKDKLQQISSSVLKVSKKRYPTITGYMEALSKEEISRAGGLMARAMTSNELRVAQYIEKVGLQNDVPRLMAVDRLINSALRGRTVLERTMERMKKIELSPEAQQLLAIFETMPKLSSRADIENLLKLSQEERQVIKIIQDSKKASKDDFSIYAVSRYASAPSLKKGFKSGREQFAIENNMTPGEIQVAKFADETLGAAFKDSGLDPKRHLNGYFPHLRMWVKEGFTPNEKGLLPDDVLGWVSGKFRSGELNVYETDPVLSVYRHVRSLYMAKHFDPALPEINLALKSLKSKQAHDIMQEYILELKGKPHESFNALQGSLNHIFKTLLGREAPDRLASDLVNSLGAITSSAMIPYRPALIVRNFFESLLKVAPRTGLGAYMNGLRYVISPETRKEAFKMAMEAGAIRPGTAKLRSFHAAEDLFGAGAPNLADKYLRIFDKGFEWYQSADDWGRAVAFHSQRLRYLKHSDDFMRQRITLEEFKDRAKINTYDPLDIQIVERFILDSEHEKAVNHLGQVLSRETMTRYGYADHPSGWHSVPGRLLGQFGTWPVQYKDYLVQGFTRGSTKDRVEFGMLHGAISGSIVGAGAAVGVNLESWTGSMMYTGGPYADIMMDAVRAVNGSDAEKAIARHNLYAQVPVLGWMDTGNPRSLFLPGSYLVGDLGDAAKAMERGDVFEAVMSGSGVRVMRPNERATLDMLFSPF